MCEITMRNYHKTVTKLDADLPYTTVAPNKLIHVSLATVPGQSSQINASSCVSRHRFQSFLLFKMASDESTEPGWPRGCLPLRLPAYAPLTGPKASSGSQKSLEKSCQKCHAKVKPRFGCSVLDRNEKCWWPVIYIPLPVFISRRVSMCPLTN